MIFLQKFMQHNVVAVCIGCVNQYFKITTTFFTTTDTTKKIEHYNKHTKTLLSILNF